MPLSRDALTTPRTTRRTVSRPRTFAIATMTRRPHKFAEWLTYYRELGAAHIFLCIEDSPDADALAAAHGPDFVSVLQAGATEHNPFDTVIDRQIAHVNRALAAAEARGIEWLFHVDDDELLHFFRPWEEIVAAVPEQAKCMVFTNVEGVPHGPTADFTTISRFMVSDDYYLAYVNGKGAGRVGVTKALGSHRFTGKHAAHGRAQPRHEKHLVPLSDAAVLHFESCPYERWRDKFGHYAKLQCKVATIPFPFYQRSIQACRSAAKHEDGERRLRAFWKRAKQDYYARGSKHIAEIPHLALVEPIASRRASTRKRKLPPQAPAPAVPAAPVLGASATPRVI